MTNTVKSRFEGIIAAYSRTFGTSREDLKKRWKKNGLIKNSTNELTDYQKNKLADDLWTSIINNIE